MRLQSPDEQIVLLGFCNASLSFDECVVAPHNVIHIQNQKAIATVWKTQRSPFYPY
ncbi:hypothetical protein LC593_33955 [Nostoc sp. CHAB 5844]|nr:hypothetical protein [Nostoc sp. CHAB 5844]